MGWASILAVTDGTAGTETVMTAAIDLGRRCGARVTFLHVSNDPRDLLPYVGEGMSGTALEQVMASVEAANERRLGAMQASFKKLCRDAGLPIVGPDEMVKAGSFAASLEVVTGHQPDEIERCGRLADVILVPHAGLTETDESASTDAALFGTGRPVIVVPAETQPGFGSKVAIAWNGTREGSLAASAALPLLKAAKEVVVITARDSEEAVEPSALARYLAGHGVEARTWAYKPGAESIAESLLEQARNAAADCLVMGAYGHSRLRERILGGATEGMLRHAKIPVLMMH